MFGADVIRLLVRLHSCMFDEIAEKSATTKRTDTVVKFSIVIQFSEFIFCTLFQVLGRVKHFVLHSRTQLGDGSRFDRNVRSHFT